MQESRSRLSNILILDGHTTLPTLADCLKLRGFNVTLASSLSDARLSLEAVDPQAIVMSLQVGEDDGLIACSILRTLTAAPIIVYGESHRRSDPVLALKLGADQYIAHPASVELLEAAVEAAVRRSEATSHRLNGATGWHETSGQSETIQLSVDDSTVEIRGVPVDLTPTELRLFEVLISRTGYPVSRVQLSEQVWGEADSVIGRAIDTHIKRLRAKLQVVPVPRPVIRSVRGYGYRLVA